MPEPQLCSINSWVVSPVVNDRIQLLALKKSLYLYFVHEGCPAGQATTKEGLTPQRIAKKEGLKDAMKELKKQNTFQNKCTLDIKPKGFAEPWAVKVCNWIIMVP